MQNKPYINGDWIEPISQVRTASINPATGEVITHIWSAGVYEVESAVSAAKNALQSWRERPASERADYLRKMATLLRRDIEELSVLSSKNNGKPLLEARYDVEDAISTYEYYAVKASELDERQEQNVPLTVDGVSSYVRFESAGVVALIVPWNFPLVTSAWKIAPALAAGCTIILKPAEPTALIELELGRIAHEAQLPPGVLNIVPGEGTEVGECLTRHADVNKISFTGSNQVGEKVMMAAAQLSKNISLELGGKSPILVFEDAVIDQAVEAVSAGIFYNCGQMCSATSRLIVHKKIEKPLLEKLLEAIEKINIGPGLADTTTMGPMTTAAQLDKVLEYLDIAVDEKLELLTGGKRVKPQTQGFFIEPTVYRNVPTTSRLWQEEIFGPVLCTRTFENEEQAVELANNSRFGLAATIVSADEERLRRVSRRLEAGHIWWNMPQIVPVETSWGGFKESGIGRELGPWGLSPYLEVKHIDHPTFDG